MHKTNQYKSSRKQAAYEEALDLAAKSDLSNLAIAELALVIATQRKLSAHDARQIAAQAVRVERGRRNEEKK